MTTTEAAEPAPAWALEFIAHVARLRKDGDGPGPDDPTDPWEMENDHAYDTLHEVISDARALLGWQPGRAPLDSPEYLAVPAPAPPGLDMPLVHGRVYEDAGGKLYLYREEDLDGHPAAPHFLVFGAAGRVGLDEPEPPLRPYGAGAKPA